MVGTCKGFLPIEVDRLVTANMSNKRHLVVRHMVPTFSALAASFAEQHSPPPAYT